MLLNASRTYRVAMTSPVPQELWRVVDSSGIYPSQLSLVSQTPTGKLLVVIGGSQLVQLSFDGTVEWALNFPIQVMSVFATSDGTVYAAICDTAASASGAVVKISSTGQQLWTRTITWTTVGSTGVTKSVVSAAYYDAATNKVYVIGHVVYYDISSYKHSYPIVTMNPDGSSPAQSFAARPVPETITSYQAYYSTTNYTPLGLGCSVINGKLFNYLVNQTTGKGTLGVFNPVSAGVFAPYSKIDVLNPAVAPDDSTIAYDSGSDTLFMGAVDAAAPYSGYMWVLKQVSTFQGSIVFTQGSTQVAVYDRSGINGGDASYAYPLTTGLGVAFTSTQVAPMAQYTEVKLLRPNETYVAPAYNPWFSKADWTDTSATVSITAGALCYADALPGPNSWFSSFSAWNVQPSVAVTASALYSTEQAPGANSWYSSFSAWNVLASASTNNPSLLAQ